MRYLSIPQKMQAMMKPEIVKRGGSYELHYRDQHSVSQESSYTNFEDARFAAFKWLLVRGLFTAETCGGCIDEVAAALGVPVWHTPPTQYLDDIDFLLSDG